MRPGHWNDPDILQIGKLGKPNQPNTTFVQTRLTPDEQYTHVTLWCLLSAPLIVSCDLEHIDSFTMGLLTNDEVIAVDQDPAAPSRPQSVAPGEVPGVDEGVVRRFRGGWLFQYREGERNFEGESEGAGAFRSV